MGKPAAKQGDRVVATDTHILMVPSPGGPVPTPTPMPFSGIITQGTSTDVLIEGKPAATVDSVAMNTPPHIPAAGPFQKPPSNQAKIMVGSTGVFINGKPAARQGDMAMTCNDPVDAPIGQVVAVGTVFIGETGAGAPAAPSQPGQQPKILKAKYGQLGTITSADWERDRAKSGAKVKMIVKVKDFKDGTPAKLSVWQRKDSQDIFIAEIEAEVQGNKVETTWQHSPEKREIEQEEGKVAKQKELEFYFAVDIEGEEASSGALVITQEVKLREMLEVPDVNFNFNSAVLLPERLPIRDLLDVLACCYLYAMQNSSKVMLIVGHTDISGGASYNHWLSEKRAENVLHILLGERDKWVKSACSESGRKGTPAYATQKHPDGKSKVEDYQMILKWVASKFGWSCDPGKVEDERPADPGKTEKAIKVFQEEYNRAGIGKTIKAEGFMNRETWGAFFDIYMLELAELLGLYKVVNGNQMADTSRLKTYRNALKFVDGRRIVKSGESHPITRHYKSLTDRRVEILFFDPSEKPKLNFYPDCHEGLPFEIKGATKSARDEAEEKADECELYGKPGIYQTNQITCDLDHTLFIEVLDHEGNHMSDIKVDIERVGIGSLPSGKTNANGVLIRTVPDGNYVISVDTQKREDLKGFEGVEERVEIKTQGG